MTPEAWTTLILLIAMFGLLLGTKLPMVVVMLGTLTAMITLRIVSRLDSSIQNFFDGTTGMEGNAKALGA